MLKKCLAMLAVALTALMLLPVDDADARGRGGGGGFRGGGGGFRVGHVSRGPAFRAPVFRPGPRVVYRPRVVVRRGYVAPLVVVGSGCEWMRQRALVTGSPYWWRRYHLCRGY